MLCFVSCQDDKYLEMVVIHSAAFRSKDILSHRKNSFHRGAAGYRGVMFQKQDLKSDSLPITVSRRERNFRGCQHQHYLTTCMILKHDTAEAFFDGLSEDAKS